MTETLSQHIHSEHKLGPDVSSGGGELSNPACRRSLLSAPTHAQPLRLKEEDSSDGEDDCTFASKFQLKALVDKIMPPGSPMPPVVRPLIEGLKEIMLYGSDDAAKVAAVYALINDVNRGQMARRDVEARQKKTTVALDKLKKRLTAMKNKLPLIDPLIDSPISTPRALLQYTRNAIVAKTSAEPDEALHAAIIAIHSLRCKVGDFIGVREVDHVGPVELFAKNACTGDAAFTLALGRIISETDTEFLLNHERCRHHEDDFVVTPCGNILPFYAVEWQKTDGAVGTCRDDCSMTCTEVINKVQSLYDNCLHDLKEEPVSRWHAWRASNALPGAQQVQLMQTGYSEILKGQQAVLNLLAHHDVANMQLDAGRIGGTDLAWILCRTAVTDPGGCLHANTISVPRGGKLSWCYSNDRSNGRSGSVKARNQTWQPLSTSQDPQTVPFQTQLESFTEADSEIMICKCQRCRHGVCSEDGRWACLVLHPNGATRHYRHFMEGEDRQLHSSGSFAGSDQLSDGSAPLP